MIEIKQINGCTNHVIEINGTPLENIDIEQQLKIILSYFDGDLEPLFHLLLNDYGNDIPDSGSYCELCGMSEPDVILLVKD